MAEMSILSQAEFMVHASLSEEELTRWLKHGLLVPAGRTAGKAPLFASSQVETVQAIRSLLDLGYDEEGVSKIVRKVGLPAPEGVGGAVPDKLRTVGELAQACAVNARTIKHWEEKELLEPDARSEGGFRLYGPATIERCRRIMDLQNIGYTLEEIRGLSDLLDEPEAVTEGFKTDPQPQPIEVLESHSKSLKERLDQVGASSKRLEDLLRRRGKATSACRSLLSKYQKAQREQK